MFESFASPEGSFLGKGLLGSGLGPAVLTTPSATPAASWSGEPGFRQAILHEGRFDLFNASGGEGKGDDLVHLGQFENISRYGSTDENLGFELDQPVDLAHWVLLREMLPVFPDEAIVPREAQQGVPAHIENRGNALIPDGYGNDHASTST